MLLRFASVLVSLSVDRRDVSLEGEALNAREHMFDSASTRQNLETLSLHHRLTARPSQDLIPELLISSFSPRTLVP